MYFTQIVHKNSVSTLEKGHWIFITKTNQLMMFRGESCCLMSDSHETKTDKSMCKIKHSWMLKQAAYKVISVTYTFNKTGFSTSKHHPYTQHSMVDTTIRFILSMHCLKNNGCSSSEWQPQTQISLWCTKYKYDTGFTFCSSNVYQLSCKNSAAFFEMWIFNQ
jgi:hypothetical protein